MLLRPIDHSTTPSYPSTATGRAKQRRGGKVPYGAVGDGRGRLLLAEALDALRGRHICCLGCLASGFAMSTRGRGIWGGGLVSGGEGGRKIEVSFKISRDPRAVDFCLGGPFRGGLPSWGSGLGGWIKRGCPGT